MRHEIGIETIAFGRDYPHPEGTWPTTKDYLRVAFDGVPEQRRPAHARRERSSASSASTATGWRGSPSASARRSRRSRCARSEVRPELVENFANRSGYLKPSEGAEKIPFVDALLREDLAGVIG